MRKKPFASVTAERLMLPSRTTTVMPGMMTGDPTKWPWREADAGAGVGVGVRLTGVPPRTMSPGLPVTIRSFGSVGEWLLRHPVRASAARIAAVLISSPSPPYARSRSACRARRTPCPTRASGSASLRLRRATEARRRVPATGCAPSRARSRMLPACGRLRTGHIPEGCASRSRSWLPPFLDQREAELFAPVEARLDGCERGFRDRNLFVEAFVRTEEVRSGRGACVDSHG